MSLNNLRPPKGAKHPKKRIGRGQGSGNGKTAGRGHKGAKSRSGFHFKRGFEGGQMPLHRRVPKRGFHNPFRVEYEVVNLDQLEAKFDVGALAVFTEGFSGTEIEQAVIAGMYLAFARKVELAQDHIIQATQETHPLSKTVREEIRQLQMWAMTRTRSATTKR